MSLKRGNRSRQRSREQRRVNLDHVDNLAFTSAPLPLPFYRLRHHTPKAVPKPIKGRMAIAVQVAKLACCADSPKRRFLASFGRMERDWSSAWLSQRTELTKTSPLIPWFMAPSSAKRELPMMTSRDSFGFWSA